MGRVKLKIKKLQNMNGRQCTYTKRRHGIMKKAKELSILCDIDVVLLMFSPMGKASICIGKHRSDHTFFLIPKYLSHCSV
uniref:DNA-binding protein n=1 Tax=Arabidopsis thaliana TaxID=3702 RepID=Q9C785_ARATH|nr:DNA-binding protein [Arabidopsis thaliana]